MAFLSYCCGVQSRSAPFHSLETLARNAALKYVVSTRHGSRRMAIILKLTENILLLYLETTEHMGTIAASSSMYMFILSLLLFSMALWDTLPAGGRVSWNTRKCFELQYIGALVLYHCKLSIMPTLLNFILRSCIYFETCFDHPLRLRLFLVTKHKEMFWVELYITYQYCGSITIGLLVEDGGGLSMPTTQVRANVCAECAKYEPNLCRIC